MVEDKEYDIIFMDMQMPELDGVEATRQIRQKLADKNQPTIVALTANVLKGERDNCLQAGMDDYISKPIKIESIKAILEQYS